MKKIVIAIVLIVFSVHIQAQTNSFKTGALLWKISGKDLSKPSYLLGTFHLKSSEYINQISGAKALLDAAEQVVGEIDMKNMMSIAAKVQQKMMMPSDTTYKMLYSDADYQVVDKGLKDIFGAGLDQMGILKPSGIQMSYLQILITKYFPNVNPMDLLDSYFQKVAEEKEIPVVGLETPEHQIYVLFESSSLQRQADKLLCDIRNSEGKTSTDEMRKYLLQMEVMYDKGDLDGLYKIAFSNENPCPDTPEENNLMNKDRNDAWVKKLPGLMKDKSSFIAVGALHLAGEEGLLNQLEKAGYKVEAVNN